MVRLAALAGQYVAGRVRRLAPPRVYCPCRTPTAPPSGVLHVPDTRGGAGLLTRPSEVLTGAKRRSLIGA